LSPGGDFRGVKSAVIFDSDITGIAIGKSNFYY
jgi:hypothetical protein